MSDVTVGDTWTLAPEGGLGTGIGTIPAGAEVVVDAVLPAFSPGVAQVDEPTVCCTYDFTDFVYDASGVLAEGPNSRRLAFSEADFRALFSPAGGGE